MDGGGNGEEQRGAVRGDPGGLCSPTPVSRGADLTERVIDCDWPDTDSTSTFTTPQ